MAMIQSGVGTALSGTSGATQVVVVHDAFYFAFPMVRTVVANGLAAVNVPVTLPRNAVVERFLVLVGARRADHVFAANVAEVRVPPPGPASAAEVVLDLGVLRTVRGVGFATEGPALTRVFAWNGIAFGDQPVWESTGAQHAAFSEIRTDRLRLDLSSSPDEAALQESLYLTLPDAPAGLELSIDGGAPVWTHPGSVQPGPEGPPATGDWNAEGHRLVDLTDALGVRVGDPSGTGELELELRLSARVPGELGLSVDTRDLAYVSPAGLPAGAAQPLDFPEEGLASVELTLPAPGLLHELRLVAEGAPLPRRVLPPVGPESDDRVELAADPDHTFAVRIFEPRLASLGALRLPLAPGPDGAEARIVLWDAGEGGEPLEPLPDGTSEPVTLEGAAAWTSFDFDPPVEMDSARPLWAALVLARGALRWEPTAAASGDPAGAELRRLLPGGRWGRLPAPFREGGPLASIRGRVRVVGEAPKGSPLPPLVLEVPDAGASTETTPAPGGAPVTLAFDPPHAIPADRKLLLHVTSRATDPVTLRGPLVVWKPTG